MAGPRTRDHTRGMSTASPGPFGELLRAWRRNRRFSQLDLALASDVSQRHVSFLESGRAAPSRDMILRLAEGLEVPLRDRNALLTAAGFAAYFRESSLDGEEMAPVRAALEMQLSHHLPYPAIVIDREWNMLMGNHAVPLLFSLLGDLEEAWQRVCGDGPRNVVRLTLHPQGLRPHIRNWQEFAPHLIQRTRREALATGSKALQALLDDLKDDPDMPPEWHEPDWSRPLTPVLPMELQLGTARVSMFSMISTFGTPQDITTDELRVESFYPADAATEQLFQSLGKPQH